MIEICDEIAALSRRIQNEIELKTYDGTSLDSDGKRMRELLECLEILRCPSDGDGHNGSY